jgi:hypothetical protein
MAGFKISWFWPSTKSYYIYIKLQNEKIQKGYIKFNYVVFLSDTGSSCHVTVMGSLIVLVNKRAD